MFFEDACLSFPSNLPMTDGDQRFVLRNVNISFPEKEISIVCGKTGSGKSLLLSAILNEVDIISGSVNVPRAPSVDLRQRRDGQRSKLNLTVGHRLCSSKSMDREHYYQGKHLVWPAVRRGALRENN